MWTFVNNNGRRSNGKTQLEMEDERKWVREELICHFIIFTASFASWNIGRLLAIITMNGHKNPTLFYDLTLYKTPVSYNGSWWKLNNDMYARAGWAEFDFKGRQWVQIYDLPVLFFVPNGLFQIAIFEAINFRGNVMNGRQCRKHNTAKGWFI